MKEKSEDQNVVHQHGNTLKDSRVYRVGRPFRMPITDGPLQRVGKGTLVRLSHRSERRCLVAVKFLPLNIGEIFEASRDFRTVSADGTWLEVKKGDIVKLTRKETLSLLKTREVKENNRGDTT